MKGGREGGREGGRLQLAALANHGACLPRPKTAAVQGIFVGEI